MDSLIGSENRSTDTINVNRISVLYDMMVESIEDTDFFSLDFARQVGTVMSFALVCSLHNHNNMKSLLAF